nr:12863_t:CDS:2 [Entrophospora candida]
MSQQFFKLPSSEIGSNHEGFLTSAPRTSLAIAGEDYCILASDTRQRKGVIYRFDPVPCNASGSGETLIQPFLDNQPYVIKIPLPLDKAITIAKDAFTSAVERDMYTGDYLEIFVITKDRVEIQSYDLKKD